MEKFNDPYPVSFKSLIPEFLKAYDEMKEDVEKTKDLLNKHKRKSWQDSVAVLSFWVRLKPSSKDGKHPRKSVFYYARIMREGGEYIE